jgi:hypothetical protein
VSAGRTPYRWIKARASVDSNNCVEVAADGDAILVRNSRQPDGPVLAFTRDEWSAFLTGMAADEFALDTLDGAAGEVLDC